MNWEKLPEGAVRVHFGSPESYIHRLLSEEVQHIKERYLWLRQDWTDAKYGDAISLEQFDSLWRQYWTDMTEGLEVGFA